MGAYLSTAIALVSIHNELDGILPLPALKKFFFLKKKKKKEGGMISSCAHIMCNMNSVLGQVALNLLEQMAR
jgi:hypothetical protein